jgi:hypothetical protein
MLDASEHIQACPGVAEGEAGFRIPDAWTSSRELNSVPFIRSEIASLPQAFEEHLPIEVLNSRGKALVCLVV